MNVMGLTIGYKSYPMIPKCNICFWHFSDQYYVSWYINSGLKNNLFHVVDVNVPDKITPGQP